MFSPKIRTAGFNIIYVSNNWLKNQKREEHVLEKKNSFQNELILLSLLEHTTA